MIFYIHFTLNTEKDNTCIISVEPVQSASDDFQRESELYLHLDFCYLYLKADYSKLFMPPLKIHLNHC